MVLSAIVSMSLDDAATYLLRSRSSLMDSHDGHDSIHALFRHGDVEERVLAGEGFGGPFSGNGDRSVHICHVEQDRQRCKKCSCVEWFVSLFG